MSSLKSLKIRIKSVKSTQKITKAMKMVSAAKLRHAREKLGAAKPYAEKMYNMIAAMAQNNINNKRSLLNGAGQDNIHLLIMITSAKGLCGALNSYVAKQVKHNAQRLISEGKEVKILCIGKKGYEIVKRDYAKHIIDFDMKPIGAKKQDLFEIAQDVSLLIQDMFVQNEFDYCKVYYTSFQSAISQLASNKQIIPFEIDDSKEVQQETYEYEPNEEEILRQLLPKNLAIQLFYMLLESQASEHGARMTAMDNATRNSTEMIEKLNLQYNRNRQACITRELIEIISGAEAV